MTKRDLFHIFHKHGKLAQISLKQAYGFVQFLEASACYDALSKEQGASIRGRKIRELRLIFLHCSCLFPDDVQTWRFLNHKKVAVIQDQLMANNRLVEDRGRQKGDEAEPSGGASSNDCHLVISETSLLDDETTIAQCDPPHHVGSRLATSIVSVTEAQ